jgi:hypothetical protein
MHAMDCEVRGNSALGGGETLGDHGAAIDASCSWGMPEWTGVGEDVLEEVSMLPFKR